MPLDVEQIAAVQVARRPPEVVETDVVERRGRGEAGDVPAELGGQAVRLDHHGQRIPPDQGAYAVFQVLVAREGVLLGRRDGVGVGRVRAVGQVGTRAPGLVDELFEQIVRTLRAFLLEHALERIEPLPGFFAVGIFWYGGHGLSCRGVEGVGSARRGDASRPARRGIQP